MNEESDYSHCVICCNSFQSARLTPEQSEQGGVNSGGDDVEDLQICSECLVAVTSAANSRDKSEEIEVQVRSLQMQVLRLLKDLQLCFGSYLDDMKVIEDKISSSPLTHMRETILGRNDDSWFRDGVVKTVQEFSPFYNQLSVKVNCADDPSNDSQPAVVKIEADEIIEDDESEYSNPASPVTSDLDKPRRNPRCTASTTTATNRKTRVPNGKQKPKSSFKPLTGKRAFLCEICPSLSFRSPYHLEQHLREHEHEACKDNPKIFPCPHCNLSFALKQLHIFHVACHEGDLKSFCDQCNKRFPPLELGVHFKESHGTTKIFQCDNCVFTCSTRNTYLEHLRRQHNGTNLIMACDLCSEKFNTRKDHLEHLHKVHRVIEMVECRIDGCDKTYLDSGNLKEHQALHTKPLSCQHCDHKCPNQSALDAHQLKHTTKKPFKCSRCPKIFKSRLELSNHEKKHDRDAKSVSEFQCHLCEMSYKHKRSLEAHLRMHEGQGYTCDQCGFTCGFKSAFKTHMQTHEEVEPRFFCEHCARGFKWERQLKKHVLLQHVSTEKYPCPDCGKIFSKKWNLKQHSTIHSEKMPFACDLCGKGFRRSGTLSDHKRLLHGKEKDFNAVPK